MSLFTVNLKITDWPCLVVGGGAIACFKARRLLEAGGRVTIVAPQLREKLPGATFAARPAELADLDGMRLAIFATDDPEVNRTFFTEAARRGILAAAADDLEACDFFMPALLRRDDLEIAVSSSGKCPAFAVWVRDRLAEQLDGAYGRTLSWLASWRDQLRGQSVETRKAFFARLLKPELVAAIRQGTIEEAAAMARRAEDEIAKPVGACS